MLCRKFQKQIWLSIYLHISVHTLLTPRNGIIVFRLGNPSIKFMKRIFSTYIPINFLSLWDVCLLPLARDMCGVDEVSENALRSHQEFSIFSLTHSSASLPLSSPPRRSNWMSCTRNAIGSGVECWYTPEWSWVVRPENNSTRMPILRRKSSKIRNDILEN